MSRITRWKPEKTKTKVVFRLQFHATHIPQSGWDKLFVTFIPADSGKATAKTTKANVRNGTCKWADPIYETTRLLQDTRTKHFDEKLYKFVISMGSSRSSLLGEATINLADYADALRPTSVALPLHGCEAILHITVQLLTSKTRFREFEQQRELTERGLLTTSDLNSRNESVGGRLPSPGDTISDNVENSRINLKPPRRDHLSHEEDTAPNEDRMGSPIGFDGSSNTSGSLYADKHDTASSQEIEAQNSDQKYPSTHGTREWIHSWGSEYSGDNDLAIAYEENSRLRGSLESAESSFHELKLELSSLQGHADELGVEAQKFAQQLAAEMASGENLAQEVVILKTECSKFKREIEVLKENNNKFRSPSNSQESAGSIEEPICQDLQHRWLKGLLFMEDKLQELQKKACFRFDDMDPRVLGLDLESMLMMLKDLKQGTGQVISSLNFVPQEGGVTLNEPVLESNLLENEEHKLRFGLGTDLYQPEIRHSDDVTNSMKNKIDELMRELDESKVEKESLAQKMDQMECYYHALIQELEGNQRHMLGELQNLRNEHSACLYAVSSKTAEMERMRQDMNDKIILFTEEKQEVDARVKEFERRAMTAEAALKRARLNYSIAVGQLQKDLEVLSSQISSMYEANQNLIKEAFQDPDVVNPVRTLKSQAFVQNKQSLGLGGEVLLDDLRRSLNLQEELYRKIEDEVRDMHHDNAYLDILSLTLRGTLLEAISDTVVKINEKDEMTKQLGFCKQSNDVLMLRLQTTLDEVGSLNREKAALSAKFYEMTQWNEKLEASLQSATDENGCLMQKNAELESSLEKEISESSNLKNGNVTLQEKLMNLTLELHKLESVKENLEKRVSNLQEELQGLLTGHKEKVSQLTEEKENLANEREMANASLSISESAKENLEKVVCDLQQKMQALVMCQDERLSQLMEEVEVLTKERDTACASSSALESAKKNLERVVTDLRQKLLVSLMHHDKNFDGASLDLFAIVSQLGEFQDTAQQKISRLTVETDTLATERDEARACLVMLESAKENLQKIIDNLGEKLRDLLMFHHKNFEETSLDLFDIVSRIGEHQHNAHQKISQILGENEVLVKERDLAHASLSSSESEKENLKNVVSVLQKKLQDLLMSYGETVDGSSPDLMNILSQLEEFQSNTHQKISKLIGDKEVFARERDYAKSSLIQLESDNHAMKEKFESDLHDVLAKINISDSMVQKLQLELEGIADRLKACLKDDEIYKDKQRMLIADLNRFEDELEGVSVKNGSLAQEIFSLQHLSEELGKSRLAVEEFAKENHSLTALLCDKTEESAHLVSEVTELRESVHCLNEEMKREQGTREELENMISDLTSQLNETHSKLPDFEKQSSEIVHLRESVSNLESEKLRLGNLLLHKEECLKMACQEAVSRNYLEDQLLEMHDILIASDVHIIFVQAQYQALVENVVQHLKLSEWNLADLHAKYLDVESRLNCALANEVQLIEENTELSRNLESLRTELEAAAAQNIFLNGSNNALALELEEHRNKFGVLDGSLSEERRKEGLQIESFKQRLASSEEEIDTLTISNEELRIELLVLKVAFHEHCDELALMEEEYRELSERLSAQVLKTEEFKTLSNHLKELKDKAEAECAKAYKKKEAESPPFAVQESLRIAFIKEQYETKVQELKQQLSISKKHSEEMLLKLQDAVDETENRKRIEASHLRRNEELSMRILDLESQLQDIVSDKREKAKAYDRMKAEMECSLISLECCKEEKEKLEVSLQQCCEEKSKIELEFLQVKELLESSRTQRSLSEISPAEMPNGERRCLDRASSPKHYEAYFCSSPSPTAEIQTKQGFVSSGESVVQSLELVNGDKFLHGEVKDIAPISDHFKVQALRSSMDNLNKELEKMKNENWLLPHDDHQFEPNFPELERELIKLDKANQELGSMYPSFNECGDSGNALERVLALELELADALQAKTSGIHFQSSFLRQHSDEAGILKSFKDINELIREMLGLKGRYSAVESELKEMHGRYSQLSLQFAEVEGERQKLMMTLKCVRSSKKTPTVN